MSPAFLFTIEVDLFRAPGSLFHYNLINKQPARVSGSRVPVGAYTSVLCQQFNVADIHSGWHY